MAHSPKCALITGSSRGIGRGIAFKLAEKGFKIAVHYYRNQDAATATLEEIRRRGSDGILVRADVCSPEEIGRMFETVQSEFGRLDVFVSNARTEIPTFYQGPWEITLEQWDTALNSQAKAFLLGAREAGRRMESGGRIIAITYTPGGKTGSWQQWVAMGSAKVAMESLVRYFAVALAPKGVTVNAVSPGWVEDSVLNTLPEVVLETIRKWNEQGWTPMRRLGKPEDIGKVVTLLTSEDSSWITGQVIIADGGASLMNSGLPLELQSA